MIGALALIAARSLYRVLRRRSARAQRDETRADGSRRRHPYRGF